MSRGQIKDRKVRIRNENKIILIVCEGDDEKDYFDALRKRLNLNVRIRSIKSSDQHAKGVVKYAVDFIKHNYPRTKPEHTWCLFDSDRNSSQDLVEASRLANQHNINIAFSNPCFEVWYYTHYSNAYSPLVCFDGVDKCLRKIEDLRNYDENPKLFDILYSRVDTAITNSQSLRCQHQANSIQQYSKESDPSTNIDEILVLLISMHTKRE